MQHQASRVTLEGAPLVSVVIPTYNRRGYLEGAVRSVLSQTYLNLEVIVVDDGSTDSTRAYVAQIADSRVCAIWREHCGHPSQVRNAGVHEARGDYVAFLDSDDLWLPDKLRIQMAGLASDPACRWSYTGLMRIGEAGEPLDDPAVAKWAPYAGPALEGLVTLRAVVATSAVVVERRLLLEAGGFDEQLSYCEDYDLWHRLALRSPARVEPVLVTRIRAHGGHYSTDRAAVYRCWAQVYAKLGRLAPNGRLRAECAKRRAQQMVILANIYVTQHGASQGLGVLVAAFRYSWRYGDWWLAFGKMLVQTALPESWLMAYRRYRGDQ